MKWSLVWLCASVCAAPAHADQRFIEDPRIIDLQFGIVCPGWDYTREVSSSGSDNVVFRYLEFPEFAHPGRIVPAVDQISFVTIAQAAPGTEIASSIRIITHPPHPDTGAVQSTRESDPIVGHWPTLAGYRFSGRTALDMLGVWTITVEDEFGQVLYEIAFELVAPEHAPFVVAACD